MAKKYAVNGMVVGQLTYANMITKKYDSGSEADIYSMMFVSPEGVMFASEKKVFTMDKTGTKKTINDFTKKWIEQFEMMKDSYDRNKSIADKTLRDKIFVKANMYPAKDGRMFGQLVATVDDKGRRTIRLKDVAPQLVKHTINADGEVIINFDRDEYLYKINGRKFTSEKKSSEKFDNILTRFKVAMIAREVNGEEIIFVEDDGEYAATLETFSEFDNSRVEIGQGYEFEVVFEKGKRVEAAEASEDDDFGWDSEVKETSYVDMPSRVKVFLVKGRVADYTLAIEDDYLGTDSHGF